MAAVVAMASLMPQKTVIIEPTKAAMSNTAIVVVTPPNPWQGYSLLMHIASCESWGDPNKEPREFKDGVVLRGFPNPNDVGLAQINIPTWGATAARLGYDLMTYKGNLAMAKWIFDRLGSAPWKYSQGCWESYAEK